MIFMPPRHGKSELVSRLFSAYYLTVHPEHFVGINSYAADLAYTFSRNSRDNYTRLGYEVKGDAGAVKHWETKKGGGLWAAGVGGSITGKGFNLGIIDDPIKNAEEASSERIRERHKEWFDSTFSTREEPDASIIIIQTRWNEEDLSGYVLSKEIDEPEHWHIVNFQAIKEDDLEFPNTCTVESDNRKLGKALAPDRYPIKKLNKIRQRIGEYFFSALYQQSPHPREGNMLKRAWFEIVEAIPSQAKRLRYWDKAGTEGAGAETAGVKLALYDGIIYVEDVVHAQVASTNRERLIKQTAELDGSKCHIWVEQEPGSGGKESAESTIRNLAGYTIRADKVTGNKILRAEPLAAQAEAGNVKVLRADWNKLYLDQLTAFPNGALKDLVDATSGSFNKLVHDKVQITANPFFG